MRIWCSRRSLDLTTWLGGWTEGTLHQPAVIEDETTGRYRPATDADHERWRHEEETNVPAA
ncbi:hypothetical protein OHA72_53710 [Dactylosporangium sp. NBC_01737]|uniref:hypothetical protein n=1 Tax=Dactylosporangium sp. NBC_01737 TaxID=2975959 RepID=UPI002E113C13|nr:hypothetical protein OHA72_53710 [Dactylosporangium sp. NBC_01737]